MTTRISRRLAAPRRRVYQALIDPVDVARRRFPTGMKCQIHEFHPVVGGNVRVSLTYDDGGRAGKTHRNTDTYRGRFERLEPGVLVVEIDEFETSDPALMGEMTMTIRLTDADGGATLLDATHEGLPPGVSASANEAGWREALDRLARLVEGEG